MSSLSNLIDAAHLAVRRGELDDAERLVGEIRGLVNPGHYASTTMNLMVVEGSIAAYRGEWGKARDRFGRAHVLATHTHAVDLQLLAESWLSYVAFLESDLDRCVDLSCSVIGQFDLAGSYALFRASAMLTLLFYYVGSSIEGSDWFLFCRRRAEELNDTSVTSALIFDIAAMKASCRRLDSLRGTALDSDIRLDLLFAKSAKNFDSLGSIHVMSSLHMLLEGQVSNLLGKFDEARLQLEGALKSKDRLPSVAAAQARLELLWARNGVSHQEVHLDDILAARSDVRSLIDDDDIAVYSRRVADICRLLDLEDYVSEFELMSQQALARHIDLTQRLGERLRKATDPLKPILSR